jgi:CheY-like chemotaxis protein
MMMGRKKAKSRYSPLLPCSNYACSFSPAFVGPIPRGLVRPKIHLVGEIEVEKLLASLQLRSIINECPVGRSSPTSCLFILDQMTITTTSADSTRLEPTTGYRIVVVEAKREPAYVLRRLLELIGHEVKTANDGHSAFELVKSTEPDIVMSCIELRGLDGFELARAICESLPKKPMLIAYTSYRRHEIGERAKEAGFNLFLPKPASLEDLRRALDSASGPAEENDLWL